MGESPTLRRHLGDERGATGMFEGVDGVVDIRPERLGHDVDVEVEADHCSGRQHTLAVVAQEGQSATDDLTNAFGDPELGGSELGRPRTVTLDDRAGLSQVPQDFSDGNLAFTSRQS